MPSDLLSIDDDPLLKWSLNNAVWMFGTALSNELDRDPKPDKESQKEQIRRTRIIERWIPKAPVADPEQETKPAPGRYREPKLTK